MEEIMIKKSPFIPLFQRGRQKVRKLLREYPTSFLTVLFASVFMFMLSIVHAQTQNDNSASIALITPIADSEIIARKPLIKAAITETFRPDNLLVTLDGVDVTGILDITPEGFSFKPVQLSSGAHTLYVGFYNSEGVAVEKEFSFSTRHSTTFEEVHSDHDLTAQYMALLKKSEDIHTEPYSQLEANLQSDSGLKEKEWELSLNHNIRYLDQNLAAIAPEKKGLSLINYLFQSKYTKEDFLFLTELGDVQITESDYTVSGLARRGGRLSLGNKIFTFNAFNVGAKQLFGLRDLRDGIGIDGDETDQIMGASASVNFLSDRITFKSIYATGGEEASSFGVSTDNINVKGSVAGFVLKTDFFKQKLTADAELALSRFDDDTSDGFTRTHDKAYKVKAGGNYEEYNYELSYEYIGPDFGTAGNQGIQNDLQAINLSGGANFDIHSLALAAYRSNNNVEGKTYFSTVYFNSASINYGFNKYPELPMGISYQKTISDSADEPANTSPYRTDTDSVTGWINHMKDEWTFGLQANHSIQDGREAAGSDTLSSTLTLTTSYAAEHISISPGLTYNRSEFHPQNMRIDTYTGTIDIRGDLFIDEVTYGLSSTYNRAVADDRSSETDSVSANFEITYNLGKRFLDFMHPKAGLRGQYSRTDDKVNAQANEETLIWLVLSTDIPFSI